MPPPGIAGAPLSFFGLSATIASVVIRSPAIDAAFCRAARTTLVGSMAVMRRASSPPRISPVHPGAVQAQARGGKAADGAFPRPWVRFPWPPGSRWPQRRLSGGPGAPGSRSSLETDTPRTRGGPLPSSRQRCLWRFVVAPKSNSLAVKSKTPLSIRLGRLREGHYAAAQVHRQRNRKISLRAYI